MKEQEFLDVMKQRIGERLGGEATVCYQEVRKNNDVLYKGFVIQRPNRNISPTVYMNSFYEMYKQGQSIDYILDKVMEVYARGELKSSVDMSYFTDFDKIKDRVAFKVINANKNRELLKSVPHVLFLDLAICFYYAFYIEEVGDGMILIHNNHMELWKTNVESLMRLAQRNTKKLFPPMFMNLDDLLSSLCEEEPDLSYVSDFIVLTNQQKCLGAAGMLYPENLEYVAEQMDGNFYIIPCSVHEVILIKDHGCEDWHALHNMIVEANATQLQEEEILSDYPYYYNRMDKKLTQFRDENIAG